MSDDSVTAANLTAQGSDGSWINREPNLMVTEVDTIGVDVHGKVRRSDDSIDEVSYSCVGLQLKYQDMSAPIGERSGQEAVFMLSSKAVLELYSQMAGNINKFVSNLIKRGEIDLNDIKVNFAPQADA